MEVSPRDARELRFVAPDASGRAAWADFAAEFAAAGEPDIPGSGGSMRGGFDAWLRKVRASAEGRDLPADRVPATTYWAMAGDRIVACGNLRHRLTAELEVMGGHIGFSVRPSERCRGHAKALLRFLLRRARELGVGDVVMTCDQGNVASASVLRACGGVPSPVPGSEAFLRFVVPR